MDLDLWDWFGRRQTLSYNQRNKGSVQIFVENMVIPGTSTDQFVDILFTSQPLSFS